MCWLLSGNPSLPLVRRAPSEKPSGQGWAPEKLECHACRASKQAPAEWYVSPPAALRLRFGDPERPRTLKTSACPHDDLDFSEVLQALFDGGFIHYGSMVRPTDASRHGTNTRCATTRSARARSHLLQFYAHATRHSRVNHASSAPLHGRELEQEMSPLSPGSLRKKLSSLPAESLISYVQSRF
jgi:hypothetical protein